MQRATLLLVLILAARVSADPPSAGNALQFDGVNDLVRIPDSSSLDLSTAATIEFWCRPLYPTPPSRDFQRIINKGDGANGDTDRAYEIAVLQPFHSSGSGFACAFFIGSSTYTSTIVPYSWQSGTWVHFAATFSLVAGEVRTYVNGDLAVVSATTAGGQPIDQPIRNSSYPLNIGAYQEPGIYFAGQLDEVRIWNITRTPCEIEANYNRQIAPNTPGLVGYWRFDESVGMQTVIDSSPAGNNGTLGISSGAAPDDPARVASTAPISGVTTDCNLNGISDPCDISSGASQDCNSNGLPDECEINSPAAGQAIQFDGANDYVQISDSPSLNLGQQVTMEFWLYQRTYGHPDSGEWLLTKSHASCSPFPVAMGVGGAFEAQFQFEEGGSSASVGSGIVPLSTWVHFAATLDSTVPVARGFVNGIQTSVTNLLQNGQPIPSLPLCTNNASVMIGGLVPFPNNHLDGQMEELRIWNIARSQSDIQSTMNRRLTGLEPGLVAYYRFDEGSGTIATNLATGYGVGNGTLVNGAAWMASTAPIFVPNQTNDCNSNGIPDDCDISSGVSQDCNSNGVPDSCEISGFDCNNNDILDSCDIANSTSYDCNQDQIPDECQPVLDADGDGIQDGCDNCPMVINPNQANNDMDAFGNACDNCPNTFDLSQTDSDGDGLGDLCDNCPGVTNPGQEDCDNDGYGDACGCSAERGDMNGDGLVNALDTQLFVERLLRP